VTATPEQRTLRDAATQMREQHPVSHPRHEMWWELASLLEYIANPDLSCAGTETTSRVLFVARAYLAAVERPDIEGRIL